MEIIIAPFYEWKKWDSMRLSHLPTGTELMSGRTKIQPYVCLYPPDNYK